MRVTHATPAAAYASAAHRDWESDHGQANMDDPYPKLNEEQRQQCPDIARQLIEDEYAQQIKVKLCSLFEQPESEKYEYEKKL